MAGAAKQGRYVAFAVAAGVLVLLVAYANRLTFPFPWNDEARFFLPAKWWAEYGSLSPLNVHAPHGIFWVPDGFTIWLGLILRCFGDSMQVARAACECSVALSVTLFALAFRRLAGSWQAGVLATMFVVTPAMVFAANMVRMEAPLCLVLALALLLHASGYRLAAGALLFGSLVFHPALGFAAVGYAAACLVAGKGVGAKRSATVVGWIVLVVVALVLAAEAVRIVHHAGLFQAHMKWQAERKMDRSWRAKLAKPQFVILLLSAVASGYVLWRARRRGDWRRIADVLPVAMVGLGVILYAVVGGELAYDVYSLAIGPACVFCLVSRALVGGVASPALTAEAV